MSAQPATEEGVIELDTSRIYQFPRAPEPMNPITAEPVEYVPPTDAVIPKPKRQRKAKSTGKPVGRPRGRRSNKDIEAGPERLAQISAARAPAADAAPAPTSLAEAGAAPVPTAWMASVLDSGGSGPMRRFWRWAGTTSAVFIMGGLAAVAVGAFIGVIRLQ